jgi:hypothetical protein
MGIRVSVVTENSTVINNHVRSLGVVYNPKRRGSVEASDSPDRSLGSLDTPAIKASLDKTAEPGNVQVE